MWSKEFIKPVKNTESSRALSAQQESSSQLSAASSIVGVEGDEELTAITRPEGRKATKAEAKKARESEDYLKEKFLELQVELVKDKKRKLELYLERKGREAEQKARKEQRDDKRSRDYLLSQKKKIL